MVTVYHHLDTVAVSLNNEKGSLYWSPSIYVLTEFEAVIAACEWALKEINE